MENHHITAILLPSWGHTISYCYLVTSCLQKDPTLVVTIVQHNLLLPRMEDALKTCKYDSMRLRIIGVGGQSFIQFAEALEQLVDGWKTVIIQLCDGSDKWPKPHALHGSRPSLIIFQMDSLVGGLVIEHTKEIIGPDCKILSWFSMVLAFMSDFLDEDEIPDGTQQENTSDQVVGAWKGSGDFSGRILKFPGVPDMYDHERFAYGAPQPAGAVQNFPAHLKFARAVDGYIVPTSVCVEPVGVPYIRDLLQKQGKQLFAVGPQALCWMDTAPVVLTQQVVKSFLEDSVTRYGSKSVLYISFGSIFFPVATPELVAALVDTLMALEESFPFIFALGSEMASISKDVIERVNSSGKGLICDFWVEQRAILQHGAVGWFLTHGGYNSISEALSQGIPLIVWPICSEQPINAALFSSGPDAVAIELMQIRAGAQRAPSLRGGPPITGTVEDASVEFKAVFAAARGARGAVLKDNATKMARALRAALAGELEDALVQLVKF
ncbi:hypothetical protein B0H17DRAFT_1137753 [Mycena rosella]|uniref:Glycosyltransferase n=1 Tax=Mycena rosella TaxID=1033263 RepID=A0AAD7GF64_MYCRO|nr:hypothetical protein B0H17DRAFT_1137753 [Mycena rosella]